MAYPAQERPPLRRWRQYSLRTLLVVVAVVAACVAAWRIWVEPYRRQREAMVGIDSLGGVYITEDATGWMRYLDKDASDIVFVDTWHFNKPNEFLPYLAGLPRLRTLVIRGREVDSNGMAVLSTLNGLTQLKLDGTSVSDNGLAALAGRTHLKLLGQAGLVGLHGSSQPVSA